MMDNNAICIVEQDKGDGMLFLASENQKYFFWVNTSNDCNWECDWEVLWFSFFLDGLLFYSSSFSLFFLIFLKNET